ncbi:putative GNAT family acetyltransferase [Pullulanibacillus pueri]|uniref:N-acetyltransferase n=1 Tax=Pullulanibacillus pueri TaxID=1437324 RepID=A0A8J3EPL5_9BACL|nr:GNAT family N-acetyltransferase [Pullulanibacillus pueri]MBM7684207.1 putative GNAT family acetyltransferase [Pullulanibacillus pueri]GGH88962.1 hypothetical protein GCM10007096_42480 [Pullulanibacillus pueri]
MDIKEGHHRFYIERDGKDIAEITYRPLEDDRLVVDHTYVSEELRGQGIAEQLVKRIIDFARAEKKKIIPQCPYVKIKMERNKDYHDVLAD